MVFKQVTVLIKSMFSDNDQQRVNLYLKNLCQRTNTENTSAGWSKVAGGRRKSPPTWLVLAGYSA